LQHRRDAFGRSSLMPARAPMRCGVVPPGAPSALSGGLKRSAALGTFRMLSRRLTSISALVVMPGNSA
jgi:hypothetical protein